MKAFLAADARVPPAVSLPDAEDRFICAELEARRAFPILEVMDVLRAMSQATLLETQDVVEVEPTAALSVSEGLEEEPTAPLDTEFVSLSPEAR